jgi:hypothetical protein
LKQKWDYAVNTALQLGLLLPGCALSVHTQLWVGLHILFKILTDIDVASFTSSWLHLFSPFVFIC